MLMYAEFFDINKVDCESAVKYEPFEVEGNESMELGRVIRQLYSKFDVVDYIHYTGDVRKPLNKFFSEHMQFSFSTSKYWIAVHFN